MAFNLRKLAQITGYFLRKYDGKINYTKLIKELYIADKTAIGLWDMAISTDSHVSMNNGPVLSKLYDLVKGEYPDGNKQATWDAYFYRSGHDLISLVEDKLPTDELSDREIELLDEVDREYHDRSYGWLIEYTHNESIFPEYTHPAGSSLPITTKEILTSIGRDDIEAEEIVKETKALDREEESLNTIAG